MTRAVTLVGYAVLVVAALGLEIRARRRGSGRFADAVAVVLQNRGARLAVLATWLWLGWHLFVRHQWR